MPADVANLSKHLVSSNGGGRPFLITLPAADAMCCVSSSRPPRGRREDPPLGLRLDRPDRRDAAGLLAEDRGRRLDGRQLPPGRRPDDAEAWLAPNVLCRGSDLMATNLSVV